MNQPSAKAKTSLTTLSRTEIASVGGGSTAAELYAHILQQIPLLLNGIKTKRPATR
jgi:hypothetical protein